MMDYLKLRGYFYTRHAKSYTRNEKITLYVIQFIQIS